jgi:hypothetical protein
MIESTSGIFLSLVIGSHRQSERGLQRNIRLRTAEELVDERLEEYSCTYER